MTSLFISRQWSVGARVCGGLFVVSKLFVITLVQYSNYCSTLFCFSIKISPSRPLSDDAMHCWRSVYVCMLNDGKCLFEMWLTDYPFLQHLYLRKCMKSLSWSSKFYRKLLVGIVQQISFGLLLSFTEIIVCKNFRGLFIRRRRCCDVKFFLLSKNGKQ